MRRSGGAIAAKGLAIERPFQLANRFGLVVAVVIVVVVSSTTSVARLMVTIVANRRRAWPVGQAEQAALVGANLGQRRAGVRKAKQ